MEDDGIGLGRCIVNGGIGYGFSGAELDVFLKICIRAIVEQGGRPTVHLDCITFDPRYEGLGIGTYLLTWGEERAKQALDRVPADLRFAPRVGVYRQAETSKKLFEDMGYQRIRSSYSMRIDMDTPPIAPEWPAGITLRIYNPETDLEAVYRTDDESFRDHFGHVDTPFEEGLKRFKHFMKIGRAHV